MTEPATYIMTRNLQAGLDAIAEAPGRRDDPAPIPPRDLAEFWARLATRAPVIPFFRGKRYDGVIGIGVEQQAGNVRIQLDNTGRLIQYDAYGRERVTLDARLLQAVIIALYGAEECECPTMDPLVQGMATLLHRHLFAER